MLGYVDDGGSLVTMAMNGWGRAEPAWWLNLQAQPDAIVRTRDGVRPVRARRAQGEERERLWGLMTEVWPDYDAYQTKTGREIPIVVLERA